MGIVIDLEEYRKKKKEANDEGVKFTFKEFSRIFAAAKQEKERKAANDKILKELKRKKKRDEA